MEPEYLTFFSNTGSITVRVRFKDTNASIREQRMHPDEIQKLINGSHGGFISRMYFDEHLMELEKIEISILENRVVLHARPLTGR
jgi:hypothetical protein